MIKLEYEQEREAQEEAVGCYGLNGVQYSPPAHHLTPQKFPISTHPTKKKRNGERNIEIAAMNYKQKRRTQKKRKFIWIIAFSLSKAGSWLSVFDRREEGKSFIYSLSLSLMNIKTKRINCCSLSLSLSKPLFFYY